MPTDAVTWLKGIGPANLLIVSLPVAETGLLPLACQSLSPDGSLLVAFPSKETQANRESVLALQESGLRFEREFFWCGPECHDNTAHRIFRRIVWLSAAKTPYRDVSNVAEWKKRKFGRKTLSAREIPNVLFSTELDWPAWDKTRRDGWSPDVEFPASAAKLLLPFLLPVGGVVLEPWSACQLPAEVVPSGRQYLARVLKRPSKKRKNIMLIA